MPVDFVRAVILAALMPATASMPVQAAAGKGTPYTTQIRAHGVVLSLSLARASYPQNALVRVTVRLRNVSRKAVLVGGTGAAVCEQRGPEVRVTDDAGRIVYPPAMVWSLASCGPFILPRPLRPGAVLQRRLFAILRGPRIGAVESVGRDGVEVATPLLTVSVVPESPPHLTLTPQGIDIAPAAPGQRGTFYFVTSILCLAGSGGSGSGITRFMGRSVSANGHFRLPPGCEPITRWSFAGGWVNHPAVEIEQVGPIPGGSG